MAQPSHRHRHKSYSDGRPVLATPLAVARWPVAPPVRVFVHLPKCGGTTLTIPLASCSHYGGGRFHRFAVGHRGGPPVWLHPGWTGALKRACRTRWLNRFVFDHVAGHFPIEGRDCYDPTSRFFTLTRDPVARELSSYNFHYQRGFLAAGTDLLGLYRAGQWVTNPQTRLLAGAAHMAGPADESTLAQAKANLSAGDALAAPVEAADTLLRLLLALNGWPPVLYHRAQITRDKAADSLDATTVATLRAWHSLDVALHAWVTQRWQQLLAEIEAADTSLAKDATVLACPADARTKRAYRCLRADALPAETEQLKLDGARAAPAAAGDG